MDFYVSEVQKDDIIKVGNLEYTISDLLGYWFHTRT